MQVVIADPPAFTPAYDHELAAALARAGADVELVTSRFRFGEAPRPAGYRRSEPFYPLSSRLFRRSPLRLPLKAVEHVPGTVALLHRRPDILHLQWLAAPALDARLLRPRVPSVFTAHDLLPRRTQGRLEFWRRLLARFDRIVVHSEHGRAALADAITATKQVEGARLLVAGDPLEPVDSYRAAAGDRAEWRLGYLSEAEVEQVLGEATVALFPYRPELDQSGALLQALGAGVPAVAYDVGGIAEPIRSFGAGRVVAPGDVDALAAAARELLDDPAALESARAGARRAREALTWHAAARAHLDLYEELL